MTTLNAYAVVLPTSWGLLREQTPLLHQPLLQGFSHYLLQNLARRIVQGPERHLLEFGIVDSPQKWQQIRQLRLETYQERAPYMLSVLNSDGSDEYDGRSLIFGVWYQGQALATIRCTSGPFEIQKYLSRDTLTQLFSLEQQRYTIELSRMIARSNTPFQKLMPALITFMGTSLYLFTDFRYYIGYGKPKISQKVNHDFMTTANPPQFKIGARGDHCYEVMSGNLRNDLQHVIQQQVPSTTLAQLLSTVLLRKP